jgi:molybdopterin adenylyltransferase
MRAAILTISISKARGEGEDESGERLARFAEGLGAEVVLTTGSTGFAPSDVTPEAILGVIDREAPGLAEAMRLASREHTPNWMLSRAVAGTRGSTLIVSFPGSPRSIEQAGEAIAAALPHALELLAGHDGAH